MVSFSATLPYYPTTFLERGASVSFTTPMLLGTRVRPGERVPLELIVPNPSGGRGQYILPWNALQDLCRPTLYDRSLQKAVACLSGVTPATIRRATREVAAGGLAGREVKNSAREAIARDNTALIVANYYLLLALVQEVTPSGHDYGPPTVESAAAVQYAAQRAVSQVGPQLGLDSGGVARALEELAVVFSGIGLGPDSTNRARLHQTMKHLAALHRELGQWISECGDDADSTAQLVRSCTALTLTCANITIDEARGLAAQPTQLLRSWQEDAEAIAAKVTRPEWILDGWDNICGVWGAANGRTDRRKAISEIAHIAPVMPKEAGQWVSSVDVTAEATSLFRRLVDLNHDWRSGDNVFQATAWSEQLLALSYQELQAQ